MIYGREKIMTEPFLKNRNFKIFRTSSIPNFRTEGIIMELASVR